MLGGANGRYEFMSLTKPLNRSSPPPPLLLQRQGSDPTTARLRLSESPTRRRGSGSSSAGQVPPPEEDGIRLNPSFARVALSSLLAVDLWMSKRLGVCACEDSAWGSVRPLMKLIEISGHGIPWLAGAAYCLYKSDSAAGQEVMLNLLMGKSSVLSCICLLGSRFVGTTEGVRGCGAGGLGLCLHPSESPQVIPPIDVYIKARRRSIERPRVAAILVRSAHNIVGSGTCTS